MQDSYLMIMIKTPFSSSIDLYARFIHNCKNKILKYNIKPECLAYSTTLVVRGNPHNSERTIILKHSSFRKVATIERDWPCRVCAPLNFPVRLGRASKVPTLKRVIYGLLHYITRSPIPSQKAEKLLLWIWVPRGIPTFHKTAY